MARFGLRKAGISGPWEPRELVDAVLSVRAVVWFDLEGIVLDANENFCKAMGYGHSEVIGKSHRTFVDPAYAASPEYGRFWQELCGGKPSVMTFSRRRKDGTEIWLEAAYIPVRNADGVVIKIVKLATDVTEKTNAAAESRSRLDALDLSQAEIEFDLSGKTLAANKNFLAAVGYSQSEVVGQHHRIFVDPGYAASTEYREFWAALATGKAQSGEFRRFGKGGREVWLQATYNPILDGHGRPVRVVKFASDITEAKQRAIDAAGQLEALGRSQAVIEFEVNGTVLTANKNFLDLMGYRLEELVGNPHSIFVPQAERGGQAYKDFWSELRAGKFQSAEFCRITKEGQEVWIQATYNPILGADGRPVKVVKFATDVTARKNALAAFQAAVGELAEGNLAASVPSDMPQEFHRLREDFVHALQRLSETLGQVIGTSTNIKADVGEIAAAAEDLSKRTEGQAATLEQTSAALHQISDAVRSSSENARDADRSVRTIYSRAEESGKVMGQASAAMTEIEASSGQVAKILGVIEDIAFQTNLLALNAGVEAARAGDAGRGFAVVASEVRALAQRSSEAAKDIKQLIATSGEHVSHGATLVSRAGEAMREITEAVGSVSTLVAAIAASSEEQANGLAEINIGVNQLDQVTQKNAAMVEEATAATLSLNQDAETLARTVAGFRIGSGSVGADVITLASRGHNPHGAETAARHRSRPASTPAMAPAPKRAAGGDNLSDWEAF